MRWGIGATALAVFVLVVLYLRPSAAEVEVARVERGQLTVTLEEEGETRVHPRYVIAAPVGGALLQIELDEGDAVKAGDIVALLSPPPLDARGIEQAEANWRALRAAQSQAESRAEEARTAYEQARANLERHQRLAAAGQLSASELEQSRATERGLLRAYEAARSGARAAAFAASSARAALLAALPGEAGPLVPVRVPASGVVLRLYEDSARVVAAGTPLLEIGDPKSLEVVIDVLTTDALAVRPGMRMSLDLGSGRQEEGRVRRVEPAAFREVSPLGVEEQRVNVVGEFVTPAAGIGDRFRVVANLVLWEGDVLRAPAGAVFHQPSGWAAFVVEKGRARLRPVGVGHRSPLAVEILNGLAEGDRVIVYPADTIADGTRLKLR
jgi:HlyD family secretion protein